MRRPLTLMLAAAAVTLAVLGFAQPRQGREVDLPDGEGKEDVQALCVRCHELDVLARSPGYTRKGWAELLRSMLVVPGERADTLLSYLARHYPEKPTSQAVLLPGSAKVEFHEWMLPTLGSRPHDPLAAPDGSIWWTGQWANVLGRLDPGTGAMKEYPLKTPDSGPHGLVAGPDGAIWYTGISANQIGRLDPKTGDVTEYAMPDPNARGPHTPVFDRKGRLWFTLQSGMVGRLIPATGVVRIVPTPTART